MLVALVLGRAGGSGGHVSGDAMAGHAAAAAVGERGGVAAAGADHRYALMLTHHEVGRMHHGRGAVDLLPVDVGEMVSLSSPAVLAGARTIGA